MTSNRVLDNNEFFAKLADLFSSVQSSKHRTIFLNQKRYQRPQYSEQDDVPAFADISPSTPLPILIRASSGGSRGEKMHKSKFSTVVQPDQLEKFYHRYGEVCKSGMQGLKKRDRSGRKKAGKAKKNKSRGPQTKA